MFKSQTMVCFMCLLDAVCVFMALDGSQHSSTPDGMFRKPSKGQSLISYLSEQDFGSCADLEKVGLWFLSRASFMQGLNNYPENESLMISLLCRRTPISASLSPWSLPSSWWSTTCSVRRWRARKRGTATLRFSSSSRRYACGGSRSAAADCLPAPPPSTVSFKLQLPFNVCLHHVCSSRLFSL